ncbi:MAG: hypothetical protein UR72_C0010G0003 [Parcubacteria group bacterium GW2011_GWC1_35_21]|nr:MAG: hypothetical protein UR72_C0010G0003 [Parcubacteria group bacterium GW2011_GWC1_35_21]
MIVVRISSKFRKTYKKLSKFVKVKAEEKEKIFRENPFDSRLETHKLHGKYKDFWAFTVVGQYRVMFSFINQNLADFVNIGTHDIYK